MNKKSKKMMIRLGVNGQQPSEGECEGRLQSIVKTFRQNNLKLMQQIQECNRKRELQQEINIRRANQKVPFDKLQDYLAKRYCNSSTSQRPFSQFKTERKLNMNQEDRFKKQNLAIEPNSRLAYKKSQDCSEYQFESQSDKNLKLVKINMKKLVPLTIDRLKERIKML